jgi:hypothetical protein
MDFQPSPEAIPPVQRLVRILKALWDCSAQAQPLPSSLLSPARLGTGCSVCEGSVHDQRAGRHPHQASYEAVTFHVLQTLRLATKSASQHP